jgi:predicted nucleic acid-binding protein
VILVDTSVWIDHLHAPLPLLIESLEKGLVLTHPFVIGELACAQIRRRREFLDLLDALPPAVVATDLETLKLIEDQRLSGRGIGYTDAHLLASTRLTDGARFWTGDKTLRQLMADFGEKLIFQT